VIARLGKALATAEAMGILLVFVALQIMVYGISESLRNTDTNNFLLICMVAAMIGYGLSRAGRSKIQASTGIAALGFLIVWILGARLTRPLLDLGQAVLSLVPQITPAIRDQTPINTSFVIDAWMMCAKASLGLSDRVQTWLAGFNNNVLIDDALLRGMFWILTIWLCSAWTGWFTAKRNAVITLLPSLVVVALITSYSERKIEALWAMVVVLFFLMGTWDYRTHQKEWERGQIDFSDSIRFDNGQAVLVITIFVGAIAFITPSVSWQDVLEYVQERQTNRTAEMLGVQESAGTQNPVGTQEPSLPREHLLSGGYANSEKIVMTIRTGELSPLPFQVDPVNIPRYYWRSSVYDQYVGTGWVAGRITPQFISANTPLIPGLLNDYRIVNLDVKMIGTEGKLFWSGFLFSMDIPFTATWRVKPTTDLLADQSALLQADIFAASSPATSYHAVSYVPIPTIDDLKSATAIYPGSIQKQYLALPNSVPERVRALAQEITDGLTNSYDKTQAIETYLRKTYPYDLNVPTPPQERDVADYFLFDLKKGYCDYFATTMVVLARSVGLPARFVSGYAPGFYDAPNAEYVIRELDAHSWVEVYFPEIGWIEFEPTPAVPEIDRSIGMLASQVQDNEITVFNLVSRFKRERILFWLTPILVLCVTAVAYFTFLERWLVLRLAPATAIENIYQRFYRAGRPLAGEWTFAETSTEFLHKLNKRINEFNMHSRFKKLLHQSVNNANQLTDLYHSSLFTDHQSQPQDAQAAWGLWIRLRYRLFVAKLLTVVDDNKQFA